MGYGTEGEGHGGGGGLERGREEGAVDERALIVDMEGKLRLQAEVVLVGDPLPGGLIFGAPHCAAKRKLWF